MLRCWHAGVLTASPPSGISRLPSALLFPAPLSLQYVFSSGNITSTRLDQPQRVRSAQEACFSNHSIQHRASLEKTKINDTKEMKRLPVVDRCVIHCLCWVIARKFGNALKDKTWNAIHFSIESHDHRAAPGNSIKKARLAIPELLRNVILLLNMRSVVYDYYCYPMFQYEDALDKDLLIDFSSYASVVARNQYHDIHRVHDQKWMSTCKFFHESNGSFKKT
eukprot:9468101-Pyramimonas_sp.AAC.1